MIGDPNREHKLINRQYNSSETDCTSSHDYIIYIYLRDYSKALKYKIRMSLDYFNVNGNIHYFYNPKNKAENEETSDTPERLYVCRRKGD